MSLRNTRTSLNPYNYSSGPADGFLFGTSRKCGVKSAELRRAKAVDGQMFDNHVVPLNVVLLVGGADALHSGVRQSRTAQTTDLWESQRPCFAERPKSAPDLRLSNSLILK